MQKNNISSNINPINKNIVALGATSLFTDFATEMILPLLPIFLDKFLHATKGQIGIIEGIAEFGVALLIAFSGFVSDRLGSRKKITIIGYGLSNLIKPFAFFASSSLMIGIVRLGDRIGKGIRTAPKDALISAFTIKKSSGYVFGFHQMMDSVGAVAGSFTAFLFLRFLGDTEMSFRIIFAVSLVPGIIALIILIFFVNDIVFEPSPPKSFRPSKLPREFYMLVVFQALFSLVAMNYSFMILKASNDGISIFMIPLAYAFYSVTQTIFVIPIGKMADKYGKATLLSVVYAAFGAGALMMASGLSLGSWIGFGIYGFFAGGFIALAKAIISDVISAQFKATAYGIYYVSIGLSTLISLVLAGIIWDKFGSDVLFIGIGCAAFILAFILFSFRGMFVKKQIM
ncbi:MAG: MFS transporter [Sulfurovaceae bacterium]|nr:MFS transporter [Sulfurovaceae bacterium]